MSNKNRALKDTDEASAYMGGRPSASTLARWRSQGVGPKFVRLSATIIAYRPEDLDAFIAERLQVTG